MENNNQNLELVNNLIELLTLEEIDIDLYRGPITKEPVSYTHLDLYKRQVPRWL